MAKPGNRQKPRVPKITPENLAEPADSEASIPASPERRKPNPKPVRGKVRKKYRPRPTRKRSKTQITVRIEDFLRRACMLRAEREGLSFTDLVEFAIEEWVARQEEPDTTIKYRFIASKAHLENQELGIAFQIFLEAGPQLDNDEYVLGFFEKFLAGYKKRAGFPATIGEMQQFIAGRREPERARARTRTQAEEPTAP